MVVGKYGNGGVFTGAAERDGASVPLTVTVTAITNDFITVEIDAGCGTKAPTPDGFTYSPTPGPTEPQSHQGDISCGVTRTGDTTGVGSVVGNAASDHFFYFTLSSTTTVTFDGCNSAFDTYFRVYDRGLTTQVAGCDDCGECASSTRTKLEAQLVPREYAFVVDGYSTLEGAYNVTMTCDGGDTPPPTRSPLTQAPTPPTTATPTPAPTTGAPTTPAPTTGIPCVNRVSGTGFTDSNTGANILCNDFSRYGLTCASGSIAINCPTVCGCPTECEDTTTGYTSSGAPILCPDMFGYNHLNCGVAELARRCPLTCGGCTTPNPTPVPHTPPPSPAPTNNAPTFSVCAQSGLQGLELFEAATGYAASGSAISTVGGSSTEECSIACLGVRSCKAFTYTAAASQSECALYSSKATLDQLDAAAGSIYFSLAKCSSQCPADFDDRVTQFTDTRPTFASSYIHDEIASDLAGCSSACENYYSCKSFTFLHNAGNANYKKCQLYATVYSNTDYHTGNTNKDLYSVATCTPRCVDDASIPVLDRFTKIANKRPRNAGGYTLRVTMSSHQDPVADAADCAQACNDAGSLLCKGFNFLEDLNHGSYGQCSFYAVMYSHYYLVDHSSKAFFANTYSTCAAAAATQGAAFSGQNKLAADFADVADNDPYNDPYSGLTDTFDPDDPTLPPTPPPTLTPTLTPTSGDTRLQASGSNGDGDDSGAVAGAVIAVILGVALVVALAMLVRISRKSRHDEKITVNNPALGPPVALSLQAGFTEEEVFQVVPGGQAIRIESVQRGNPMYRNSVVPEAARRASRSASYSNTLELSNESSN